MWDDHRILFANRATQRVENIPIFFSPSGWNRLHQDIPSPYRPLRETAFTLTLAGFGPRPFAFRALSAGLHVLNTLLVLALCSKLLRSRRAGFWAALVFAAMPVHVEAAAWIKNLGEVASLAFAMGALLVFLGGEQDESPRWPRAFAAAALAAGGLLFKESALFVLPMMLAAAWLRLSGNRAKTLLLRAAPSAGVTVAYLFAQFRVMAQRAAGEGPGADIGLLRRAAYVCETMAGYVRLMLLPFNLNPWYDFPPPERLGPSTLAAVGFCAAMIVAAVALAKRRPPLAWWLLWIGAALAPASNILINEARPLADQRAYAASAGAAALLGWAVATATRGQRRVGLALGSTMALCFAVAAVGQSRVWSSQRNLWRRAVRLAPDRAELRENLAWTYWREMRLPELAEQEYAWAARLAPDRVKARADLVAFLLAQGRVDAAEEHLAKALAVEPDNARAAFLEGQARERRGLLREAIAAYTRAVELDETYADAYFNRGEARERLGQEEAAGGDYRRALAINPSHASAATNLAYQRLRGGSVSDAERLFRQALAAEPDLPHALAGLGQALRRSGRPGEAIAPLARALELRPDWGELRHELSAAREQAGRTR